MCVRARKRKWTQDRHTETLLEDQNTIVMERIIETTKEGEKVKKPTHLRACERESGEGKWGGERERARAHKREGQRESAHARGRKAERESDRAREIKKHKKHVPCALSPAREDRAGAHARRRA